MKQYNREYNFFEGMSDTEVSEFQRSAAIGHRPTWTIGANSWAHGITQPGGKPTAASADPARKPKSDPFEFFARPETEKPKKRAADSRPPVGKVALKNLRALNLEGGASKDEIKTRFKELVKRHHPDANGGDRGSEDRLREIIVAYNFLKQAGLC